MTISMMREALCEKHQRLSTDRYFEWLASIKFLPGPISTLMAVCLGAEIAGITGGIVAALSFLFPSFLMVLGIAYFEHQIPEGIIHHPAFVLVMQTLQAAVMGIVAATTLKFLKDARERIYVGQKRPLMVSAFVVLSVVLALAGLHEILILALSALLGILFLQWQKKLESQKSLNLELVTILLTFLTAGLTVFGTGYMVLPYLHRVLVEQNAWLSGDAFLNGVTWGNLTPGPVVIASTYFGYAMSGFWGALAATLGIFLGPILLALTLRPLLRSWNRSPLVEGAMLGLLPTVTGTIGVGVWHLSRGFHWDIVSATWAVLVAALYLKQVSVPKIFLVAVFMGGARHLFGEVISRF